MNSSPSLNRAILRYSLPIAVFFGSIFLALSDLSKQHPELYTGITYDLILTGPLLLFFLSKRKAPKYLVSLFVFAGIVAAYWVIPKTEQLHLNLIRFFVLPLVELVAMIIVVRFAIRTAKNIRLKSVDSKPDFYTILQQSAIDTTKSERMGSIIGSELAVIFYSFFAWKKRPLAVKEFSLHKDSGSLALYWCVLLILAVELIGLHVLLVRWSELGAWIIFGFSLYGMMMIFAHLKALSRRPYRINAHSVTLRCGIFASVEIPFDAIEAIELSDKTPEEKPFTHCKLALLGNLEMHNTIIQLNRKLEVTYMYGIRKSVDSVLFHVDEKQAFKDLLEKEMSINSNHLSTSNI
jgi:hypothetical protein